MKKLNRPSWDEYFMKMAHLIATRSTCLRRSVGAVLVRDKHVIATGYNGAPKDIRHCKTCLREEMNVPSGQRHELCRGLHAEQNAIIQAAVFGISTKGSVLYCTTQPCIICTKMLINAGITKIYITESYPDKLAEEFIIESGIEMIVLEAN